jgi:hypothetical protein
MNLQIACFHLHVSFAYKRVSLQATCGIIFPVIKAEGVRQMFFSATRELQCSFRSRVLNDDDSSHFLHYEILLMLVVVPQC